MKTPPLTRQCRMGEVHTGQPTQDTLPNKAKIAGNE